MLAGVAAPPVRYRSADEDSARWAGFPFREGDIVVSTRSKTGTTWVQMICALLIFQTPDLPASLGQLSPWLDFLTTPREQVYAQLAAQRHRRFIKTHTPLDGIPLDPRATYIVTGRHPLDMAVSLYHQGANIDRARMRELTGRPEPADPPRPPRPLREWLTGWIDADCDPREEMDSLPGVMWHLSDAWARRGEPNVMLVHYDDLSADLGGQMRRIARRLGITVPEQAWPALVRAATFESMRAGADRFVPGGGVLKDNSAFFRRGRSGAGHEVLTDGEVAHYHARAAQLAPADMLGWLHSPGRARP
jgi:aryl sulfotransferase